MELFVVQRTQALSTHMLVVVGSAVPSVAHHYQDPLIPRSKSKAVFPSYDNPVALGPDATVSGSSSSAACTVQLFSQAALQTYGQIERSQYDPPTSPACAPPWASIRLDVTGSVKGVQFDRYGAMWLGGVELLRTTTPEPSPTGISWGVSRDLTMYAAHFRKQHQAALAIPNVVDKTYTGVLYLSVNLTFLSATAAARSSTAEQQAYLAAAATVAAAAAATSATTAAAQSTATAASPTTHADSSDSSPSLSSSSPSSFLTFGMEAAAAAHTNAPADVVVAVADPLSRPGLSPFAAMNATGLRAVRGNVSIPGRNAIRALLDVYASGHECEEFWYTNVPDADNLTKLTGSCGGGPYREVEVMIDGTPAGAALPFPTIYSGGIVPQLWRPVAGIHSLNLPPLTFDLSPFLPLLNDGRPHTISTRVLHAGESGLWFLDPVLRYWTSKVARRPLVGRIVTAERTPPAPTSDVRHDQAKAPDTYAINTSGSSSYRIVGELWEQPGEWAGEQTGRQTGGQTGEGTVQPPAYVQVTTFAVSGRLNATNYNQLTDGATESNDTASGALEYHVNSSVETSVAPPTSLSAASVTAASANATHGRVSSASAVTVPAIVRRSHFRFPYRVANAQRQNNFSFFLTGDVQYGAHRSEEWGAATALDVAAGLDADADGGGGEERSGDAEREGQDGAAPGSAGAACNPTVAPATQCGEGLYCKSDPSSVPPAGDTSPPRLGSGRGFCTPVSSIPPSPPPDGASAGMVARPAATLPAATLAAGASQATAAPARRQSATHLRVLGDAAEAAGRLDRALSLFEQAADELSAQAMLGSSHRLAWSAAIHSTGAYNRSTAKGERHTYLEGGMSAASFRAPAACFEQSVHAEQGRVAGATYVDSCVASPVRAALCEHFDGCAAPRDGVNSPAAAAASPPSESDAGGQNDEHQEADSVSAAFLVEAATWMPLMRLPSRRSRQHFSTP